MIVQINISLKSIASLLRGGTVLFGGGIYNYAADQAIEQMKQKMVIGVLNKTGLSASSLKVQMGVYVIEAALKALLSHYINHNVTKKVFHEEDFSFGMALAHSTPLNLM